MDFCCSHIHHPKSHLRATQKNSAEYRRTKAVPSGTTRPAPPKPPRHPQATSRVHLASRDPRGAGRTLARRPISAPPYAVLPPAANRTRGFPRRGARAGAGLRRSGRWDPRAPAELRPSGRGSARPGPAQRGGRGDAEPGRAAPLLDGGWGAFAATRETRPQVGASAGLRRTGRGTGSAEAPRGRGRCGAGGDRGGAGVRRVGGAAPP